MNIDRVKDLLQRYQSGDCTPSENELIEKWYRKLIETGEWHLSEEGKERMEKMLEGRIMKQVDDKSAGKQPTVFLLLRNRWWWAAASVFLLLGVFGYFMFFHEANKPEYVAKILPADIKAPQSNRAMITLASGQKVFLDSAGNGALVVLDNVKLVKLATGGIVYEKSSGKMSDKMEYNILSNPRGSKVVNVILADGSRVWLNAGSSLKYPVAFIGRERKVSITGEGYFEVAHDKAKPFIVSKGSMSVRVLGTHFNVNTFGDDDENIKVTLLEGSVKIDNGEAAGILIPGQQAQVGDEVKILSNVDLEEVMAWKNGYFYFNNASLQNVLNRISRWYDINVIYEGSSRPRSFMGEIQGDLSLSEVLKILEKNKVHFRVEGRNLIVMPD